MPDDYYVSQYSGEEIDDLLGKAGSATGAVRYDAAQSLTDAQKTQARKNVNAAPGGYGLGDIAGVAISSTVEEGLNTATQNGWYYFGGTGDIENRPSLIPDSGYGYLLVSSRDRQTKLQVFMSEVNNYIAVRKLEAGVWQPWEYINPPMQLGVEYRTTERYLGKPVYCKLVNFGALPNATQKVVKHNIPNVSSVISVYGSAQDQAIVVGAFGMQVTGINADNTNVAIWTSADLSNYSAYVAMKYTKTTD